MPNNAQSVLITNPIFSTGLQGQLLIAMPNMSDARFNQSLMLICHHDNDGALGLVLNQITDLTVQDLCVQMDINHTKHSLLQAPVHLGGPMDTHRGFLLHADLPDSHHIDSWQHSLPIVTGSGQTLHLTTSLDILQAIAQGQGPEHFIFALGYAGWSAGQLEQELAANVWLTINADSRLLFNTSIELRWQQAFQSLGLSLANFCPAAGHA